MEGCYIDYRLYEHTDRWAGRVHVSKKFNSAGPIIKIFVVWNTAIYNPTESRLQCGEVPSVISRFLFRKLPPPIPPHTEFGTESWPTYDY